MLRGLVLHGLKSTPPVWLFKSMHTENTAFIRRTSREDASDVLELYKRVASTYPHSLTQQADEITLNYVQTILQQANLRGLALGIFDQGKLMGFIKGYTSEFRHRSHFLSDLTLMIEPSAISQGYAPKLCHAFMNEVQRSMHHIRFVDGPSYSSNTHSIYLQKKLGLVYQATLPMRIHYLDGTYGDEIFMRWVNVNFCQRALDRYNEYLKTLIDESSISSTLQNEMRETRSSKTS